MGALAFLSVLYWLLFCPLVSGEQVAFVEVFLEDHQDVLQGEVVQESLENDPAENQSKKKHDLEGDLVLIKDEALETNGNEKEPKDQNPWIGVVPVRMEEGTVSNNNNQESFASSVVNKMKRALVLGASALIILALNQNTIREMDLSQVLSKPIIVIQTSENVTKLIGALLRTKNQVFFPMVVSGVQELFGYKHTSKYLSLYSSQQRNLYSFGTTRRGLHATAKITYKTFLQDSLGATLTLWSTCGRSRSGLYGEWQGVICTGETNSQVQKYLQQLWNTVVLVALVLCTGVIVQARWQFQDNQFNDDLESHLKQDVLKRLSALKTRIYRQPKVRCDPTQTQPMETENCAVCLEQYNNNQCLRVLPCLHEFHRDCVDPWLLLQQTCPLCKRSVLGNHY